jgi:molybdenum cofactor cytidylyltransferase
MYKHNTEKTIAALILAAGRSSRMQHGQESYHKLLLPLGQGTVLSHVIAATLASQARPIVLVLGYQSVQVRASLTPFLGEARPGGGLVPPDPSTDTLYDTTYHDIIITENRAYAEGMSTSLHKGIQVLVNQDNHPGQGTGEGDSTLTISFPATQCAGALVLLGDQPLITPALLNKLIEMKYTTGKRIIAPFYNGKRGNPVLFDADLFPELLTITGDEGARSIIEKYRTEMGMLDIDDSQLWYDNSDVDTWEAYQQVLRIWQERQK